MSQHTSEEVSSANLGVIVIIDSLVACNVSTARELAPLVLAVIHRATEAVGKIVGGSTWECSKGRIEIGLMGKGKD